MTQQEIIARILAYEYDGTEDTWQRFSRTAARILKAMTDNPT